MQNPAETMLQEVNCHRRRLGLKPPELEATALERDWAAAPDWMTGLLLAALGNPAHLQWVVLHLPGPQASAYRFFVPLLEKMVPFPDDAKPSEDAAAAANWVASIQLQLCPEAGRYQIVASARGGT